MWLDRVGSSMNLSMFNSGQVCVGVERIYVVDSVADKFIELVREKAATVTYGQGNDVGPLFWDRQLDIVRRHVGVGQLADGKYRHVRRRRDRARIGNRQ